MGLILSAENLAEAAEVTATSEAGELGARNVLLPHLGTIWRVAPANLNITYRLDVDLGRVVSGINLLVVARPRDSVPVPTSVAIRPVGGTTTANGSDAYLGAAWSGFPSGGHLYVAALSSPIAARFISWRFFVGATMADPWLDVSRVWIGAGALITAADVGRGFAQGGVDTGSSERSAVTGTRYGTRGAVYRRRTVPIPRLTTTEADALERAALLAGTTRQIFMATESSSVTAASTSGLFGRFTEPPTIEQPSAALLRATLQVEEDL